MATKTNESVPMQMKKDALEEINKNSKLFGTICDLLEIKPTTLIAHIQRNSERLNQYVVVLAVSEAMGIAPSDIMEPKNEVAKAV